MRTFCLPNDINKIEELADFIMDQVIDLDNYVLVGDSYGAIAAIAVAIRQPKGLTGLVISGGFAKVLLLLHYSNFYQCLPFLFRSILSTTNTSISFCTARFIF